MTAALPDRGHSPCWQIETGSAAYRCIVSEIRTEGPGGDDPLRRTAARSDTFVETQLSERPDGAGGAEKPKTPLSQFSEVDGDRASWAQLQALHDRDPKLARQRWDELVGAATEELTSGIRAANIVEGAHPKPFDRARFFSLREQLADRYEPRIGTEAVLIDIMAQALTMQMFWMETLTIRATLDFEVGNEDAKDTGQWAAPRVGDYRGIDQAALLADRFNRVFARALRSLMDLRRHAPADSTSRCD